ncbi:MAG: GNAT family N-acetyltransferase [Candidatus Heimdallarchaeota archaeon]|nr:GNAT family N-acetyltransferase [Candidatus Heimdallarchaeota archaeon]
MEIPRTLTNKIIDFEYKRDVRTVLKLERERFNQPMTKMLIDFLTRKYGSNYFYVVDISGDGTLDGHLFAAEEQPNIVHVFSIAVDEKYEGQGIGKKLMYHLRDLATAHKKSKIILEVNLGNDRARQLYINMGFTENGIVDDYYGPGKNGLKMELLL